MEDAPLGKFTKCYNKSDIIFEEDSPGSEMYIVHSGSVRLLTQNEKGDSVTLAIISVHFALECNLSSFFFTTLTPSVNYFCLPLIEHNLLTSCI